MNVPFVQINSTTSKQLHKKIDWVSLEWAGSRLEKTTRFAIHNYYHEMNECIEINLSSKKFNGNISLMVVMFLFRHSVWLYAVASSLAHWLIAHQCHHHLSILCVALVPKSNAFFLSLYGWYSHTNAHILAHINIKKLEGKNSKQSIIFIILNSSTL